MITIPNIANKIPKNILILKLVFNKKYEARKSKMTLDGSIKPSKTATLLTR